ncbi:low molecular weight protein-tyrosine-phosphatase [Caldimonas aquatica]|uniref:protein-tyrosine-phosphatase n=1 Tax=Caldimonas aquatica TaxID=376175 RepID=A0ABY6MVY8_9BURK|nr:low molecular weight protein-tyrosine-phosphatase [Schlegelella aquatica]UZD56172.1 low molecular weight phosphotyrosine protein phosphatase [Schlegelella aquatica]
MSSGALYSVLFCCMGNICRSPTAEGVMRAYLERHGWAGRVHLDSAGTHGWHVGAPPDPRAQRHAAARGYDLSRLRARRVEVADFVRFDLVLAMDEENLAALRALAPAEHEDKVQLLMRYARRHRSPIVPDPYYGPAAGFDVVLDYVEDACEGLLEHVRGFLVDAGNFPVKT